MEAPTQLTLLVGQATPGQLAVLAAEAAADGNFTLSGAVAWAAAGRSMSPAEQQALAVELDAAAWPDHGDVEQTLRDIRDAYLRAALTVEAVAPGSESALRKMDLGRQLKAPVLPGLNGAAPEGTAA
jgi:hypothetical protein